MVVSGSPKRWDRWHIIPQLAVYTTYILPSGGLYATYHLLGEPEPTIEMKTIGIVKPWWSTCSTGRLLFFNGRLDLQGLRFTNVPLSKTTYQ